jgi:Glycine zipper 2TM domain
MKTALFPAVAATALLFAGSSAHAAGYDRPDYGPSMRADAQAYHWGENGNVVFAAPDRSSYDYDGEWEGEFVDPDGRVFEGEWQGTVTRRDAKAGTSEPKSHLPQAGAPYTDGEERDDGYDVPGGYERYEQCLKSNGLKGAAIGAILGGVAGNRIAGRGDRLGGTLLGAGLGGLAGAAIEKATDKCKRYRPPHHGYPPQGYPQSYPHQQQGWQGGYYYYPQSPVVVTVVPGGSHTTTTVTEEVYYETVKSNPRKKAVRKWKPRPKPRCVCR